jgi:pSer/pThr/pTyr-binding forkhead associated (FHA) protein
MSTVIGYLIGQRGEFSGARFAIPEGGLIIGRDPNHADLVLDHTMVSRRHAQIAPAKDGKLYLVDLQSRNGTHVNGRKITAPVALTTGDKLDFGGEGKVVFVFETTDTTSVSGVLNEAFGETVAPVEWKPGDVIGGEVGSSWHTGKGRVWRGPSGVRPRRKRIACAEDCSP